MDKKEQLQLKQATDDIKRLEQILVVLTRRIEILTKESARNRANVHKLERTIINLENKISRNP